MSRPLAHRRLGGEKVAVLREYSLFTEEKRKKKKRRQRLELVCLLFRGLAVLSGRKECIRHVSGFSQQTSSVPAVAPKVSREN